MTDERIDWQALAEPVALALLGPPNKRLSRGDRWRWGRKGSMTVDVAGGRFMDFERDVGGGVFALVRHVAGTDNAGVFDWLRSQGLIPERSPDRRPRAGCQGPRQVPPRERKREPDDGRRVQLARRIWTASRAVFGTPALAYLSRRQAWPAPGWDGWPFPPECVAWITRSGLKRADPVLVDKAGFPASAAGAVVFAYRQVNDGELGRTVSAVTLEALDGDGKRTGEGGRWRKARGVLTGAVARLPGVPGGHQLALVEGECDGLAVAFMANARGTKYAGHVREVRVVGGTSGMSPEKARVVNPDRCEVVILADGPGADGEASGAAAAAGLCADLWREGRKARFVLRDEGDVADDLALLVMRRTEAHQGDETAAWQSIHNGSG